MFPGWFKQEGHTNPRHRIAFDKARERLKSRQRVHGHKARKKPFFFVKSDRREKALKMGLALLFLIGIITISSLLKRNYFTADRVADRMTRLQNLLLFHFKCRAT